MKLKYLFLSIIFLVSPVFSSIVVVELNTAIHPISAEFIISSINKSEKMNSPLLIIKIDTPGGLDTSMREIIKRILNSKVPVAVWVYPQGGRAASAGFLITISADIAIMSPGTSIGAAHPVSIPIGGEKPDKTMETKAAQDLSAFAKSIAEKRGRNEKMAIDAVLKSFSYSETEALKGGLIDMISTDLEELINKLNGKKIKRFNQKEEVLKLKGEDTVEIKMNLRQKILSEVANPNIALILMMLGMLGIYFELSNPGTILPGIIGAISLLLALFAFQILPVNYVGLLLILLAIGLFIAEIKVQGFGILGIGGIISMIFGTLMLFNQQFPGLSIDLTTVIIVSVIFGLLFLFFFYISLKAHSQKVLTGTEGLLGMEGEAITDISPRGKVFIEGEIWEAHSSQTIPKGARVKVVKVSGLKLEVEQTKESE
ncbi:MAG: NfeD family protein [Candidatus Aminicenantia bacterium]